MPLQRHQQRQQSAHSHVLCLRPLIAPLFPFLSSTKQMFSKSLKDLQTDYVDLLLLHYPECWGSLCSDTKKVEGTWQDRCGAGWAGKARAGGRDPAVRDRGRARPPPRSWFALEQLMREKKLRAAGVSNFNLEQVRNLRSSYKQQQNQRRAG